MLRYIRLHTENKLELEYTGEKFPISYMVDVLAVDYGQDSLFNLDFIHNLVLKLQELPIEKRLHKPTLENIARYLSLKIYRNLRTTPYLLTLNVKINGGSQTFAELEFNTEEVILNTGGNE